MNTERQKTAAGKRAHSQSLPSPLCSPIPQPPRHLVCVFFSLRSCVLALAAMLSRHPMYYLPSTSKTRVSRLPRFAISAPIYLSINSQPPSYYLGPPYNSTNIIAPPPPSRNHAIPRYASGELTIASPNTNYWGNLATTTQTCACACATGWLPSVTDRRDSSSRLTDPLPPSIKIIISRQADKLNKQGKKKKKTSSQQKSNNPSCGLRQASIWWRNSTHAAPPFDAGGSNGVFGISLQQLPRIKAAQSSRSSESWRLIFFFFFFFVLSQLSALSSFVMDVVGDYFSPLLLELTHTDSR